MKHNLDQCVEHELESVARNSRITHLRKRRSELQQLILDRKALLNADKSDDQSIKNFGKQLAQKHQQINNLIEQNEMLISRLTESMQLFNMDDNYPQECPQSIKREYLSEFSDEEKPDDQCTHDTGQLDGNDCNEPLRKGNSQIEQSHHHHHQVNESPSRGWRKMFNYVKSFNYFRNDDQKVDTRIILLNGREITFSLNGGDPGRRLFDHIVKYLDLSEKDYFGLTYVDNRRTTWVKFYPPYPDSLHEELTRYLLTLQLRQDIFTGKLPCPSNEQVLLGSLQAQSELGDYPHGVLKGKDTSVDYLDKLEIIPNPSTKILNEIAQLHKTHKLVAPITIDW